ncbi:hypothetical protein D3C81_1333720 [compost metagenome]
MKKKIMRTISRLSAGSYSGVINEWDILEETLTGASEIKEILILKINVQINKQQITTEKNIPLLWDKGDPMYNLCLHFDVLPEIGEEIDCECFVGRAVEIIVEEEEREGRIFSTVSTLRPIQDSIHLNTASRSDEQESSRDFIPSIICQNVEDGENTSKPSAPIIPKRIIPKGTVTPNRPKRKNKIGDIRPKEPHLWGKM